MKNFVRTTKILKVCVYNDYYDPFSTLSKPLSVSKVLVSGGSDEF